MDSKTIWPDVPYASTGSEGGLRSEDRLWEATAGELLYVTLIYTLIYTFIYQNDQLLQGYIHVSLKSKEE